jgi:hypothetical protein
MKKGIFWKVIACLVVLWLFLFLWMYQWHFYANPDGTAGFKTSKISSKIYIHDVGEWKDLYRLAHEGKAEKERRP